MLYIPKNVLSHRTVPLCFSILVFFLHVFTFSIVFQGGACESLPFQNIVIVQTLLRCLILAAKAGDPELNVLATSALAGLDMALIGSVPPPPSITEL